MHTAWRLFSRHRSLTALAVSTLAVAFGLAAALASAADAILLRPLPVARPNEIVRVFTASAGQRFGFVSYPDGVHDECVSVRVLVSKCLYIGGIKFGRCPLTFDNGRCARSLRPHEIDFMSSFVSPVPDIPALQLGVQLVQDEVLPEKAAVFTA